MTLPESAAPTSIANLNEAASLLSTAKRLEKDAAEYRALARQYIIDHDNDLGWERDPKGEKTMLFKTPAGTISLTRPMKQAIPAHFDQGRATEFKAFVEDVLPDWVSIAFTSTLAYEFEERVWLSLACMHPEFAAKMHESLEKYVVPAVVEAPMSERVEVK